MHILRTFLIGSFAFLTAGSSDALVTIEHSTQSPTNWLSPGDTVVVEVRVSWDGQGSLNGIFSSTASNNASILVGESARSTGGNFYRSSLFTHLDDESGDVTSLSRFGQNQLRQAVDGLNVVRSVQYGSLAPLQPLGAASNVLVTTITFRVVGAGTATIGHFLALGDTGAQGDEIQVGAPMTVYVAAIPEPGTASLLGLGLAGLSRRRPRAGMERSGR